MAPLPDELKASFSAVFEEHSDAIFRHCYFRLIDRQESADVTQEAFLRAWNCVLRGDQIDNMRAFLYKIAGNLIIDTIRKRRPSSLDALREQGFDPVHDPHPSIQDHMDGSIAISLLSKLDEPYRECLRLRYVEGMSVSEIASLLKEPPNTVSVRLSRGLKQLRSLLCHG